MVAGCALRWNALDGVLLADDWDHYAMCNDAYPAARHPLDLFNFVSPEPAERSRLRDTGRLPWWAAPDLQLSVFRPLSSALVTLDYRLLDAQHAPKLLHLHSMLWWLLLVLAVAALYRLLLPVPIASCGIAFFALDDAHILPVTWAANRSEVVALALAVAGLWAHVRARKRGWAAGRVLACVATGLGLLAGEHALAALGYFAAFELISGNGSFRQRARALAPFALMTLVYLGVRSALGYGVAGSGFYVDPWSEPLRYLSVCVTRVPLLLGDLVFDYAAEWQYWEPYFRPSLKARHLLPDSWLAIESLRSFQVGLGWLATLTAAGCTWLLCRPRASATRRTLGWLLVGGILSLIPVCGTLPMSRLTVAAAAGFDAGLGWLLWWLTHRAWQASLWHKRMSAALGFVLLVGLHLLYASVRNYNETGYYAGRSRLEEDWVLRAELDDGPLPEQSVIITAARDWTSEFALPLVRHLHGHNLPLTTQLLSARSDSGIELIRVASGVLDLRFRDPTSGTPFGSSVYRSEGGGFYAGAFYPGSHFNVMILEISAGEPIQLRYVFPRSLDDPHYVFLHPRESGMERVSLPRVGERLILPAPAWPSFDER